MRFSIIAAFLCIANMPSFAQKNASISFEQWISLKSVGGVAMSPDGKHVLYTVSSTNWKDNVYDAEIWLSRDGAKAFPLTRTENGSSSNAGFTPNSKWISFVADRGNKSQLFLISVDGGEAFPVMNHRRMSYVRCGHSVEGARGHHRGRGFI